MPLSDDDKRLFREAFDALPKRAAARKSDNEDHLSLSGLSIDTFAHEVTSDAPLFFHKGGLQTKQIKTLKRAELSIQKTIDLHGFSLHEAEDCLEVALRQEATTLKIIHGKGQQAKLKNAVNRWLRAHPRVLAFASCPPQHGGTGALILILKQKP